MPSISTRHALPPPGRTRPASKRQRGIRVSARTRDSGVLWDVPSTIASSTLPPGRLIVRVLKLWARSLKGDATPRRALTSSASLARGKKQLREAKWSASIRSMRRWVWPIADATRALKAAIRGSVAKAATATLRYEAFEARYCVRRLTPATLGVHLRDLFAMNRNKQRSEY